MSTKIINSLRLYSTNSKKSYFITTPIYYVNANPHIGHLYSSVISDAIHRWQHLLHRRHRRTKLSTGTDEHGIKIQQAAAKNDAQPADYCDRISAKYKDMSDSFSVNYTDFIRTTSDVHQSTVQKFWKVLDKSGCITLTKYEGWYCVSDETFLSQSQLKETVTEDGSRKVLVSLESGHPVEWSEEQNYVFKLSAFQGDLKHWINSNENIVKPKTFHKILTNWITDMELPDVSISRPASRVQWGIPVPDDHTQTVYVWLDALVNYLTVAGYLGTDERDFGQCWPPDVQVIGKDILKFHGIYWPAFLLAANLEPPRSILCHSHWTVDGEKMSKSKGNVVCPFDGAQSYTADGLRYFLLREGVAHSDGNYSDTKVMRILNAELADTLGNLLNRCCGLTVNPNQTIPIIDSATFDSVAALDVTRKLIDNINALPDACQQHYDDFNFYKVVDLVVGALHSANLFVETLKPWELRKVDPIRLDVVLHVTLESLRVCGILLQPIAPNITSNLLDKLNVPDDRRFFADTKKLSWTNIGEFTMPIRLSDNKSVLFRKLLLKNDKFRDGLMLKRQ